MKYFCWLVFFLLHSFCLWAQNGPGGIGSTNGVSTLRLWLSASDFQEVGYLNGDLVFAWPDLSGYNSDAANDVPSNQPVFVSSTLNGYPSLEFTRDNVSVLLNSDRLIGSLSITSAPMTMIVVGYYSELNQTSGTGQFLFSVGPGGPSGFSGASTQATISRQDITAPNNHDVYSFDGALRRVSGASIAGQVWNAMLATYNTAAPFNTMYLNNSSLTIPGYVLPLNTTNGLFSVGSSTITGVQTSYLNGRVGEVIVFSQVLNAPEINIIFNYLSSKYNIPIANDLYAGDVNANGDFDLNVAGIGLEGGANKSTASSIGLDLSIASGFSNGEYLMFGHRSTYNSVVTTGLLSNAARWSRTWYLDGTFTDGDVTADITFDFSDAGVGGNPTGSNNYALLRRNGLTWDIVANGASISGDQIRFEDITITADGEYTLGTTDVAVSPLAAAYVRDPGPGPAGLGLTNGSEALRLWLDASQVTGLSEGSAVDVWNDFSGNNFSATQPDAGARPIFVANGQNGRPVIRFDGIDDFFAGSILNFDAPGTIAAAVLFDNINQANDNDYIFDIGEEFTATPASRASISRRRNDDVPARTNRYYSFSGQTLSDFYYGPAISGQQWHSFAGIYHTSTPFHQLYFDGVDTDVAPGNASLNTSGNFNVGRWSSGGVNPNYIDGDIGEIIVFNTALNGAQSRVLSAYLSAKWNTVNTNDIYTGDDPTNGDNDFNVSGVGRTIDGDMDRGYSSGLYVSLRNNALNQSFVTYGHSSAANGINTTDITPVSGTLSQRLNRAWYFTLIGSPGTLDLTFDYSEMGIGGSPGEAVGNYVLLYRTGTSGNWTVVATANNVAGDQVRFVNVAIPSNGFYTLGVTSGVLPIHLGSFTARVVQESNQYQVQLSWQTLSEDNNDYFTVERSRDGKQWEIVRSVSSQSQNGNGASYTVVDNNPFFGISYYRLKQTDFDGTYRYEGGVRSVHIKPEGLTITCYPNPFIDRLVFQSSALLPEQTKVEIIDLTGRTRGVFVQEGDVYEFQLPVDLPHGVYLVRLVNKQLGKHTFRVTR